MLVCIDVDYRDGPRGRTIACAAGIVFPDWASPTSVAEHVVELAEVADYEPGQFYKRELPCVLAVLERVEFGIHGIIIDGYVILDELGTPGLGGHLWEQLEQRVPVIGVAKNPFSRPNQPVEREASPHGGRRPSTGGFHGREEKPSIEVLRGDSQRPLYVTARGVEVETAAADVRRMHGRFRLPTMLKRVDRLCRDSVQPDPDPDPETTT